MISSNNNKVDEFDELSKSLTNQLSAKTKKDNGIFFTPQSTINRCLDILTSYLPQIKTILEPSCGSAQFISLIGKKCPEIDITGIEINEIIYKSIKILEKSHKTLHIIHDDFIKRDIDKKYDLIIGNPPYFVLKKTSVDKQYHSYFTGRPNIFILFIVKSLQLLNNNGILCFVLPTNFLNSAYYKPTREYIVNNFAILDITFCNDNYIDTTQNTVIIVIQNKHKANDKYIGNKSQMILSDIDTTKQLNQLYKNSTTLSKLGFDVSVGSIVWNQHKSELTDDNTKTRLIYSSNVKNGNFIDFDFKNTEKKKFINIVGKKTPTLVVYRGHGVNYKFDYLLVDGKFEYLIENHLICISKPNAKNSDYDIIIKSFDNKKTNKFISLSFTNGAISTTELANILPIY